MNKDAKRRSVLQASGSNSSLGSDSSSHLKIYRDMGLKNISEGQTCKPLDWDYDVHLLAKVTKNPLLHIISFALGEFDLFSTLDLDESSISSFCRLLKRGIDHPIRTTIKSMQQTLYKQHPTCCCIPKPQNLTTWNVFP